MAKKRLNDTYIKNFKNPEKRVEVYDELVPGLALRVTPTGHKSFVYRYRYNNKVKRYTIGSYDKISLAKARDEAKEIAFKVSKGKDPLRERQVERHTPKKELTFRELAQKFSKRHLPTLRKKTADEYQRHIDVELNPKLGDYFVKEITRKQLIDLLDAIAIDRNASTLSNRVRSTLSSIYSFGIDKAIVEVNPVFNIKRKKKSAPRDRVYSEEEIRKLWAAFENQDEPIQSIFKVLLLLGQRSGETKHMMWKDIDFKKQIWTIPKEQTKAKRTHLVPLSDWVLDILENLNELFPDSEYVFPSPKVKGQSVEWIQKAKVRIRKESGVKDFRPHDLRRTMASNLASMETDRTVLGKLLNHKGLAGDDQVTAIYDRYDYMKSRRIVINKWSIILKQILKIRTENKILPMN
ncbi:tyrosine-type recombinase/integrase [Balneola sp. MJW-20]|uniref:tyrosine-type recombinase/integrase n=1 Tax=Gracilimonas aurantiaca TaxID=3234185 RepID=UPI0034679A1E